MRHYSKDSLQTSDCVMNYVSPEGGSERHKERYNLYILIITRIINLSQLFY